MLNYNAYRDIKFDEKRERYCKRCSRNHEHRDILFTRVRWLLNKKKKKKKKKSQSCISKLESKVQCCLPRERRCPIGVT